MTEPKNLDIDNTSKNEKRKCSFTNEMTAKYPFFINKNKRFFYGLL